MNTKFVMIILAFLVILSFSFVGIAIGIENYWLATLLFVLGGIFMVVGLRLKRKLN